MMDLERLAAAVGAVELVNLKPTAVTDLAYDTRAVVPGSLFFCVRGAQLDGHDLAADAVAAGASALAVYHVIAPLVAARRHRRTAGAGTRAALIAEKALALRTIKELEFDRAMGKMSQADFEEVSGRLKARALRVMQQIEEIPER